MPKDWEAILKELSSPESSDAEDDLNVMSVQKNANRVAELMHGVIPNLDPSRAGVPFTGMNGSDVLRKRLSKSFVDSFPAVHHPVAPPTELAPVKDEALEKPASGSTAPAAKGAT